MDQLQRLSKRKLEIDLSKLQYTRDLGIEMEKIRYWSRRNKLEEACRDAYLFGDDETLGEAVSELLTFYILYGR